MVKTIGQLFGINQITGGHWTAVTGEKLQRNVVRAGSSSKRTGVRDSRFGGNSKRHSRQINPCINPRWANNSSLEPSKAVARPTRLTWLNGSTPRRMNGLQLTANRGLLPLENPHNWRSS